MSAPISSAAASKVMLRSRPGDAFQLTIGSVVSRAHPYRLSILWITREIFDQHGEDQRGVLDDIEFGDLIRPHPVQATFRANRLNQLLKFPREVEKQGQRRSWSSVEQGSSKREIGDIRGCDLSLLGKLAQGGGPKIVHLMWLDTATEAGPAPRREPLRLCPPQQQVTPLTGEQHHAKGGELVMMTRELFSH